MKIQGLCAASILIKQNIQKELNCIFFSVFVRFLHQRPAAAAAKSTSARNSCVFVCTTIRNWNWIVCIHTYIHRIWQSVYDVYGWISNFMYFLLRRRRLLLHWVLKRSWFRIINHIRIDKSKEKSDGIIFGVWLLSSSSSSTSTSGKRSGIVYQFGLFVCLFANGTNWANREENNNINKLIK